MGGWVVCSLVISLAAMILFVSYLKVISRVVHYGKLVEAGLKRAQIVDILYRNCNISQKFENGVLLIIFNYNVASAGGAF